MGLILITIARFLSVLAAPLNFLAVLITYVKEYQFLKTVNSYQYNSARDVDIFYNRNYRALWNLTLKKKIGYKFGRFGETISSALGKNQRNKALSWFGWIIVGILYVIDYKYWNKGGHCINSIQEFKTIAK